MANTSKAGINANLRFFNFFLLFGSNTRVFCLSWVPRHGVGFGKFGQGLDGLGWVVTGLDQLDRV